MEALRGLYAFTSAWLRAFEAVRFRILGHNGCSHRYADALTRYQHLSLSAKSHSSRLGPYPIQMLWPGRGWIDMPHPHEVP